MGKLVVLGLATFLFLTLPSPNSHACSMPTGTIIVTANYPTSCNLSFCHLGSEAAVQCVAGGPAPVFQGTDCSKSEDGGGVKCSAYCCGSTGTTSTSSSSSSSSSTGSIPPGYVCEAPSSSSTTSSSTSSSTGSCTYTTSSACVATEAAAGCISSCAKSGSCYVPVAGPPCI